MTPPFSRRTALLTLTGIGASVLAACSRKPAATPVASTSETTAAASSAATTGSASPTAAASAAASSAASSAAPASTAAAGAALPEGVVNVLVVGSDLRGDGDIRKGNADVITLVQLTADRKHLNMVSIPRDTLANLPTGGRGKMNSLYPLWGPQTLMNEVSRQLGGLEIHHVMEIGFVGFRTVVLKLEKVVVNNRYFSDTEGFRFDVGDVTLPTDRQALGALWFCRERKTLPNGDLDRTERQRATLTGFMVRLAELASTDEKKLVDLLPVLWRCLRPGGTVTVEMAQSLIPVVKGLKASDVSSVILPIADYGMVDGASVDLVNAGRARELADALKKADLSGYIGAYGTSNATTG